MPWTPKTWRSETNPLGPPAAGSATPLAGTAITAEFQAAHDYVDESVGVAGVYTDAQVSNVQQWASQAFLPPCQGFDFSANGTKYFTAPFALSAVTVSGLNGSGAGTATIAYAVNGVTKTIPFAMNQNDELSITVGGLSSTRVSFTLLFGQTGIPPVPSAPPVITGG